MICRKNELLTEVANFYFLEGWIISRFPGGGFLESVASIRVEAYAPGGG